MKIGEKIAELRREKGVTQAELADQLHFTRQAVSNWERGVTEPDAHTLPVLAAYFGITTDELLGAAPVRNAPPAPEKTAPLKKHRVEVRETARAAKALHSLLWTYAGLTAVQFLLSFSRNIFVALIGEATSVLAASANLAVFILFLCAKQPSERRRVRAAFYICWATCEVCSFVYLFTEGTAALIFGIAFLLLTPAECVLLPLAFQTEDKAALRRYFIVLCIYIALALPAALTALLSPEFAYYLTMLADVANIASLFLLDRALCDRTVESYYYTAQTSVFSEGRAAAPQRQVSDEQLALAQAMREQIAASNAAHSREVREQAAAPAKPSPAAPSTHAAPAAKSALHEITADVPAYPRALLPAAFFIGIGLFLLFILFAPPGSSVAIFVMLVLLFSVVPAVFGVLFFLVKAGRKKVPHALARAVDGADAVFRRHVHPEISDGQRTFASGDKHYTARRMLCSLCGTAVRPAARRKPQPRRTQIYANCTFCRRGGTDRPLPLAATARLVSRRRRNCGICLQLRLYATAPLAAPHKSRPHGAHNRTVRRGELLQCRNGISKTIKLPFYRQ